MRLLPYATLALFLALLGGCGQTGPLYHPQPEAPDSAPASTQPEQANQE